MSLKEAFFLKFHFLENGERKLKDMIHVQRSKSATAGFKPQPKLVFPLDSLDADQGLTFQSYL